MKKLIPTFLFVITSTSCCLAQNEFLDVKIIPNPSDISGFVGKHDYKSVKQRIAIIDYDINNRNAKDTSSIINYDSEGREGKYVLFERGKRYSITTYDYPAGKNLALEYMQNLSPRYLTYFRTNYDKQGRKLSVYHAEIQNGDTTSRGKTEYGYKDSLLLQRQEFLNGKSVLVHRYLYNSSELQQAETNMGNTSVFYRYIFQYNADHMPVAETGYHFRPDGTDTLPPRYLTYKDKSLIGESYFEGTYPQKQTNVIYSYDLSGRISSKNETRDTLYRKTNFEYDGPYISAVVIKTNTWHAWEHGPLMRNVFSFVPMPVNYEIDYSYDEKGYLIKTVEKLNGVMQWSVVYIDTYY